MVIGGIGSVSGSIIASFLFIASSRMAAALPRQRDWIVGFRVPLLRSGFRMVVFSIIIMAVVLFFRKGIMATVNCSRKARIHCKSCQKGGAFQMSENVLTIENATMQFGGVVAVDNLNLKVDKDQIVSLIGPNGAGKTTLMKTLATLLQKKDGEITVCGVPIENAKEIRKIIGYLPQEFSMYPSMNVGEAME